MLELVLDALRATLPRFELTGHAVDCHHNYVAREHHFGAEVHVTRKGAIRAGVTRAVVPRPVRRRDPTPHRQCVPLHPDRNLALPLRATARRTRRRVFLRRRTAPRRAAARSRCGRPCVPVRRAPDVPPRDPRGRGDAHRRGAVPRGDPDVQHQRARPGDRDPVPPQDRRARGGGRGGHRADVSRPPRAGGAEHGFVDAGSSSRRWRASAPSTTITA